jgi:hypothetical protein
MESVVNRFGNYASAHPSIIAAALEDEFSLASLARVANRNGYEMGAKELNGVINDLVTNSTVRMSYKDGDGEMRELTLDEAQLVSGGFTLAIVAITVAAYVVVGVYAIAATTAAVSTNVWAHTTTWTYANSYLP